MNKYYLVYNADSNPGGLWFGSGNSTINGVGIQYYSATSSSMMLIGTQTSAYANSSVSYQWQRRAVGFDASASPAYFLTGSWSNISGATSRNLTQSLPNLLPSNGTTYAYRLRAQRSGCSTTYSTPLWAYHYVINVGGIGGGF